jgi:hypothetical protein
VVPFVIQVVTSYIKIELKELAQHYQMQDLKIIFQQMLNYFLISNVNQESVHSQLNF